MIVTEFAAADRWCPLAHLMNFNRSNPGSGNRFVDGGVTTTNPDNCRCLGSECMAWIWIDDRSSTPVNERTGCCGFAHNRGGHESPAQPSQQPARRR